MADDQFGGISLDESPTDSFGGVPVPEPGSTNPVAIANRIRSVTSPVTEPSPPDPTWTQPAADTTPEQKVYSYEKWRQSRQQSAGRRPNIAFETLNNPELDNPAVPEVQRWVNKFGALAKATPGLIGTALGFAGKSLKAGIGDVVGTGDTLEDVVASSGQGTPLPVDVAASKVTGLKGIAARAGLGMAETVPKIGMLAAFPEGLLAQSIAAGGIFGLTDEGGFSPKQAVIGALLPGIGHGTQKLVAKGLADALQSGSKIVTPLVQGLVEELGQQAAMDAVMIAGDSPELLDLYKKDPKAARQQVGEIVGQNLAWALFGLKKISRGTETENFIIKNKDKYAELADGLISKRIVGAAGAKAVAAAIEQAKKSKVTRFAEEEIDPLAESIFQAGQNKQKGEQNAVQIRSATPSDVGQTPENSGEVGQGEPGTEESSVSQTQANVGQTQTSSQPEVLTKPESPPEPLKPEAVVEPSKPVSEPAQKAAAEIGWVVKRNDGPAVNYSGMPEAMVAELKAKYPPQLEFTDNRPGPTQGLTFYVPEGATYDEILKLHQDKVKPAAPTPTEIQSATGVVTDEPPTTALSADAEAALKAALGKKSEPTPVTGSVHVNDIKAGDKIVSRGDKRVSSITKPVPVTAPSKAADKPTPTPNPALSPDQQSALDAAKEPGTAEKIAQAIEKLKTDNPLGGNVSSFGLVQSVWNTALDIAAAVVRAGGTVADAVAKALKHIDTHLAGKPWPERNEASKAIFDMVQPDQLPKIKNRQYGGVKGLGPEYLQQHIEPVRQLVKHNFFDATKPVEPDTTEKAWFIANQMTGGEGDRYANEIHMLAGGDMAPSLLKNELRDYAVKMALRGDSSLLKFLVEKDAQFRTLASVGSGSTAQAAINLRAVREGTMQGGFWGNLIKLSEQRMTALGRRLGVGKEAMQNIIGTINSLAERMSPEEIETHLEEAKLGDGKTIDETIKEFEPKLGSPEAKDKVVQDELEKESTKENTEAARITNQLELKYPGVEWIKPDRKQNIWDILNEFLSPKKNAEGRWEHPARLAENLFKTELIRRLQEYGVDDRWSRRLAQVTWVKATADFATINDRAMVRASKSRNVRSIIESILTNPYRAQHEPGWLQSTAQRWFLSNDIPAEQASEAAKLFTTQFQKALATASEREVRRMLDRKDRNGKAITAPQTIEEMIRAVRLGLTDPRKDWADDIAAREGFKPLTDDQHRKLAEFEQKYSGPNISLHEKVALAEQMMGIYRHAGDPKGNFMRTVGESFAASLLSGLKTLDLHVFQPMMHSIVTNLIHSISNPADFPTLARAFVESAKSWWPEVKFAWSKDAYSFNEQQRSLNHNALKRSFEVAQEQIRNGQYLKGVLRMAYAVQQYSIRALQTANQAGMAGIQQQKLILYASMAFREAGLGTAKVARLVDVAVAAKNEAYARAIDAGYTKTEAGAIANEHWADGIYHFFKDEGLEDSWGKVVKAAENDVYSVVGRRAPGIMETGPESEGMLSRYLGLNWLMKSASEARKEGGGATVLTVSMVGFMNVPLRLTKYYAGFGPYGLIRSGVHKFRQSQGMENLWKQSYGNELQSKARLREALAGTALAATFTVWQHYNSTADDEITKHKFAMFATGAGPKNKELRDAWIKRGFRPFSLNIIVNGRVVKAIQMTRVGEIIAYPLGLAAAMDDTAWRRKEEKAAGHEKPESFNRELIAGIGTYYDIIGAQGFLQAGAHLSAIGRGESNPGRALLTQVSSTASGVAVPGKALIDSVTRLIYGPVDRSSTEASILSNLPVVGAYYNGLAINRFGDVIGDRSWYGRLYETGIPFAFRVSDNGPNRELYQTMLDKGAAPPVLTRHSVEDKYGPLSQEQWQTYAKKSGDLLKKETLDSLPSLKTMEPEEVKKFLNRAATDSNVEAAQVLNLNLVKEPKGGTAMNVGGSGGGSGGFGSVNIPGLPKISTGTRSGSGAGGGNVSAGSVGATPGLSGGVSTPSKRFPGRVGPSSGSGTRRLSLIHGRLRSVSGRARHIGTGRSKKSRRIGFGARKRRVTLARI